MSGYGRPDSPRPPTRKAGERMIEKQPGVVHKAAMAAVQVPAPLRPASYHLQDAGVFACFGPSSIDAVVDVGDLP